MATRKQTTDGRKPSEDTRERILNSALKLFRERGFDQTTMRQIAAESGMALGAAYYYFRSKEALVMAFYQRAQQELGMRLSEAMNSKKLEDRLRALLETKLDYFRPYRSLLGALSRHTDPQHPLSPFSEETRGIRESDIQWFMRALEGVHVPADLEPHLPRILWLYQMGLLLFWVYDRSPEQGKTRKLIEKSLGIVVFLIKYSGLPFLRPLRKRVVDLVADISGEQNLLEQGSPS